MTSTAESPSNTPPHSSFEEWYGVGGWMQAIWRTQANRPILWPLTVSLLLALIATSIRWMIAPAEAGVQYVTYFPAVALAAIFGGFYAGILTTACGTILATYFFFAPYGSFNGELQKFLLWPNVIFISDGLIVTFAIQQMHRFRRDA